VNGDHALEALAVADEDGLPRLIVAVLGAAEQFVGVRAVARHGGNLSVEAGQALRLSEPFSALVSSYETNSAKRWSDVTANSDFRKKNLVAQTEAGPQPSAVV
jgi:hypothetical protein